MKIIYGPKGTGKTKNIIDLANEVVDNAKGHVVFITDNSKYSYQLKYKIRFLDVSGFEIQGPDGLRGFLKGIVASSGDTEYVFVDGLARIAGKSLSEIKTIFDAIEKLEASYEVKFVLTCSACKEELPDFILKHID